MKVKKLNEQMEHIINGCKQQYPLYQILLSLSQEIGQKLSEEALEGLAGLLQKRAERINDVKELEDNISSHKKTVMEILHLKEFNLDRVQDLIYPEIRQELASWQEKVRQIIRELITIDQRNGQLIEEKVKEIKGEIRSIQQHYDIQQAYQNFPQKFSDSRFFDKKK